MVAGATYNSIPRPKVCKRRKVGFAIRKASIDKIARDGDKIGIK